jgi:hypothetical protein
VWVCFWVWFDIQNRRRRVRPRASVFGTREKGTETKRKYPSTMNRRIAWTTCDGTDASFEMDPWDRARTPKNTHLPRARIGLDDGWKPHRRTNERTRSFIGMGYPHRCETSVSLDAPLAATRARVIHAPWCGLTLKTSSAVVLVCAHRPRRRRHRRRRSIHSIDRSNRMYFVSSLRVAVVDRVSCVPRACTARLGKADPSALRRSKSLPARERESGGRSLLLFTHTFWYGSECSVFGNDRQSNISIRFKINHPDAVSRGCACSVTKGPCRRQRRSVEQLEGVVVCACVFVRLCARVGGGFGVGRRG